jgi:hypothetical protein
VEQSKDVDGTLLHDNLDWEIHEYDYPGSTFHIEIAFYISSTALAKHVIEWLHANCPYMKKKDEMMYVKGSY